MNIEKALKDYRKNKGKIETSEERCNYWQYCLDTMSDDEIASEFIYEKEVIIHEVTREMVKQWITDDKSRIRPLKHEIKQIEIALGSLTEEENYVIECKCIDNWEWVQVEIGFNEKFRNEKEITIEQLKKIKKKSVRKMEEILNI